MPSHSSFLARRITLVHIVDQVIEIKTSLHLKCLYFAAMRFPFILTHPSSSKEKKKHQDSQQSKCSYFNFLEDFVFFLTCFVSFITFWVALPQSKSITSYPIHGVVTEKRNTTPVTFKRWIA